ncbi:MAG: hypothetical protein ABIG68_04210 [Acidobacteriota bacterium]
MLKLLITLTLLAATVLLSGCSEDIPPEGCSILSWGDRTGGMDAPVLALTAIGDRMYAGGAFVAVRSDTVNHVAYSSGGSWRGLGGGVIGDGPNVEVRALAEYAGDVIAGGYFSRAGAESVSNIARWDGDAWHALGGGLDGSVSALAVFDGKLVVGGGFDHAGDVAAHNIAMWDGSSWAPLGSGTDGRVMVRSLCVFEGKLIAGGGFTSASGVAANHVAMWDGAAWAPLGAGTNGPVHVMTARDEYLIAGGEFTEAGGAPANCVAVWDGVSWETLGSGVGSGTGADCVRALVVHRGGLVVGGSFTHVGGGTANNIAVWSRGTWWPVGGHSYGVNDDVCAIAEFTVFPYFGPDLWFGGEFTVADGWSTVDHLAILERLGCI